MSRRIPAAVADFWRLGGAFLLWSASFAALYALLSIGCALGWERMSVGTFNLQRLVLMGAWLVSLAAAALVVLLAYRSNATEPRRAFVRTASLALGVAAFGATAANFAAVTVLSSCL